MLREDLFFDTLIAMRLLNKRNEHYKRNECNKRYKRCKRYKLNKRNNVTFMLDKAPLMYEITNFKITFI